MGEDAFDLGFGLRRSASRVGPGNPSPPSASVSSAILVEKNPAPWQSFFFILAKIFFRPRKTAPAGRAEPFSRSPSSRTGEGHFPRSRDVTRLEKDVPQPEKGVPQPGKGVPQGKKDVPQPKADFHCGNGISPTPKRASHSREWMSHSPKRMSHTAKRTSTAGKGYPTAEKGHPTRQNGCPITLMGHPPSLMGDPCGAPLFHLSVCISTHCAECAVNRAVGAIKQGLIGDQTGFDRKIGARPFFSQLPERRNRSYRNRHSRGEVLCKLPDLSIGRAVSDMFQKPFWIDSVKRVKG